MVLDSVRRKVQVVTDEPEMGWIEAGRRLNRAYHTRGYRRSCNPDGIDVFAEDWDNLIILDSCRYDSLSNEPLPGEYTHQISRGSATREFVEANFIDRELNDVVYVSANAWYSRLQTPETSLHKFVNLQAKDLADPEVGMEMPGVVTDAALEYHGKYPNKRLVIHYMQPHHPYVTERGRDLIPPKMGMTRAILSSECSRDTLRDIYQENLELALKDVRRLLNELQGKSVVTADHGELLGDRSYPLPYREYGHPRGTYVEDLVKVPWIVHTNGERKTITSEAPENNTDVDSDAVERRLKDLGYKV